VNDIFRKIRERVDSFQVEEWMLWGVLAVVALAVLVRAIRSSNGFRGAKAALASLLWAAICGALTALLIYKGPPEEPIQWVGVVLIGEQAAIGGIGFLGWIVAKLVRPTEEGS